ncbi:unnamed protein product [Mytilus edulis]|uniref:CCHC-type domain-containing protein n=1 Tax=Mytilus edulis TaxID=6550 RepID=A0A8S3Q2D3_MYTED|nr:unnamed protein product [Mytilus edulis]
MVNENPNHIKIRVKNVPCSADDGHIKHALEYYICMDALCTNHIENLLRVDGELTNCQTGDTMVMCNPVSEPLSRFMLIGKYVSTVVHANQNASEGHKIVCRKCLQTGHKVMQCSNDWVCLHCKKPGHRQADCPEELNTSNSSSEEESDANDADTEDTEVPPAHAHDALQPSNSGDVISNIHAKDKAQSVNNHLQDKIQCDQEIVKDRKINTMLDVTLIAIQEKINVMFDVTMMAIQKKVNVMLDGTMMAILDKYCCNVGCHFDGNTRERKCNVGCQYDDNTIER